MSTFEWIQQYQTMIIGFVGFAGVIITLFANARLARKAREEARRHERQTLRVALGEELTVLRDSYAGNAKDCAKDREKNPVPAPDGVFNVPTYSMTDVYDSSLGKIGILSSAEVQKVMHAYMTHRQASYAIANLIGTTASPAGANVKVPAALREVLQKLCENMVPDLDAALAVLRHHQRV